MSGEQKQPDDLDFLARLSVERTADRILAADEKTAGAILLALPPDEQRQVVEFMQARTERQHALLANMHAVMEAKGHPLPDEADGADKIGFPAEWLAMQKGGVR